MKVPPGPGPAKYDRVFVQQLGPAAARTVLVLVPGTRRRGRRDARSARHRARACRASRSGSSTGASRPSRTRRCSRAATRARAGLLPGLQVQAGGGQGREVRRRLGPEAALADLRSVIRRARAGGRRVILGGHSVGASTAVAYAAWDFGGRPGYRDLDGLVLIDGGLLGTFASADLARARRELAEIRTGKVFWTCSASGSPRSTGSSPRSGRCGPYKQPDEPSALQENPLLPAEFKPRSGSRTRLQLGLRLRRDHLARTARADPDQRRPARRRRRPPRLAGRRADADPALRQASPPTPERHRVVLPAPPAARRRRREPAAPDARPPGSSACGCSHGGEIDVPLYAFETDLTRGSVARGARRLVRALADRGVERSSTTARPSHLDPLVAAPAEPLPEDACVPFLHDDRVRAR